MSISKGGQSVKPYVGGKEVKEAYVGSQLVYRAVPPYIYYFLGAETDYYLSENCALTQRASVTKPSWATAYKIACTSFSGGSYSEVRLNGLNEHVGKHLKFLKRAGSYANIASLVFYNANNGNVKIVLITASTTTETLSDNVIPENTSYAIIRGNSSFTQSFTLDAIRIENE